MLWSLLGARSVCSYAQFTAVLALIEAHLIEPHLIQPHLTECAVPTPTPMERPTPAQPDGAVECGGRGEVARAVGLGLRARHGRELFTPRQIKRDELGVEVEAGVGVEVPADY